MVYELIGIKDYDFEKDNRRFEGSKLFCTYEDKNTTGMACESFSISRDKLRDFKPVPGMQLEVFYNKYGKVEDVQEA